MDESQSPSWPFKIWKTSRLILSRWKRLTRWEYWPTLPLYLPVIPVIIWQALRHRSLTLFTAVNPGMPSGGFVLDSKSAILTALEPSGRVAPFALIPATLTPPQRLTRLQEIITQKPLTYPLVLKPDLGERGSGVLIAHSPEASTTYLAEATEDTIVQAYIPGVEYGIFYERPPDQEKGRITSITHKATTTVTGNGKSTLQHLILTDPRALAQAPIFLELQKHRLHQIIPHGETIPLNLIGTHSRGSLFLDACHTRTHAMETAIDNTSKHFPGFHFGRYDIRCTSLAALQRGEDYFIVELNGVTSEPTHIYDPKHHILHAWKALTSQWARAFHIAAQNRRNGHPPIPLSQLIHRIRQSKQKKPHHPSRPPLETLIP